jgi:hypothetical protein
MGGSNALQMVTATCDRNANYAEKYLIIEESSAITDTAKNIVRVYIYTSPETGITSLLVNISTPRPGKRRVRYEDP